MTDDLARERRIRALVARMRELVDSGELDPTRLNDALQGRLDAPDLEEQRTMAMKQITLRVPEDWIDRAERLTEALADHPMIQVGGDTRSTVIRLALLTGLEALERDAEQAPRP